MAKAKKKTAGWEDDTWTPKDKKVIAVCEAGTYLALADLNVHPDNPRSISRDRLDDLKASMVAKGIYQPFLIWKKGNIVLAGNQRTRAALELLDDGYVFKNAAGDENVMPVVIEDVADDIAEAILFDANNSYGNWVEEKLHVALAQAKEAGKSLGQWGFTTKQVDDLLADALKGASDVTSKTTTVPEHERTTGGKPEKDDDEGSEPTEKQEALILPRTVYLKLVDIFQDIAHQINPEWRDGDSLYQAVEAFVDFTYKEGVPDIHAWRKDQKK